jgi:hypothetical protein
MILAPFSPLFMRTSRHNFFHISHRLTRQSIKPTDFLLSFNRTSKQVQQQRSLPPLNLKPTPLPELLLQLDNQWIFHPL